VGTSRVIPIRPLAAAAAADDLPARLERAGYLRMMLIGEPQLSRFAAKYEALGYEVHIVPVVAAEAPSEALGQIYVRKRLPGAG